jgi:fatty-acyl-CoA synthase
MRPGDRSRRSPGTATGISSCTIAVSGSGAVMHTVNPRLFPEQIVYIVNHAEDKLLFVDLTFVPLVEKIAPPASAAATSS